MFGSQPVESGAREASVVDREDVRWIARKVSDVVEKAVRNVIERLRMSTIASELRGAKVKQLPYSSMTPRKPPRVTREVDSFMGALQKAT